MWYLCETFKYNEVHVQYFIFILCYFILYSATFQRQIMYFFTPERYLSKQLWYKMCCQLRLYHEKQTFVMCIWIKVPFYWTVTFICL